MRLLFASFFNPGTFHSTSGAEHALHRRLGELFPEMTTAWPLVRNPARAQQVWNKFAGKEQRRFLPQHVRKNVRTLGRQVGDYARAHKSEAVFCTHSLVVPDDLSVPTVLYMDAPLCSLLNYYDVYSNVWPRAAEEAQELEGLALRRCAKVVYASEWAVEQACERYQLPQTMFSSVPRGPSLTATDSWQELGKFVAERLVAEISILFVGVSWERKGGDIAVEVVRHLRELGVNAVLDIVGVTPPAEVLSREYVRCHGFLRKTDEVQFGKLMDLYRRAAIFLLPTRAEAMGIAFCEAAAYGVPIVAPNTGGVASAVKSGVTGELVSYDAPPEVYAASILKIIAKDTEYALYSQRAHSFFSSELTWDVGVNSMVRILEGVVERSS